MVVGRRSDRTSDSWLKRTAARAFYATHNRIAHTKIPQDVGDFRVMDRKVVEAIKRLPERRRFMKGLFAWVGFRTAVVDYVREPRAAGRSSSPDGASGTLRLRESPGFPPCPGACGVPRFCYRHPVVPVWGVPRCCSHDGPDRRPRVRVDPCRHPVSRRASTAGDWYTRPVSRPCISRGEAASRLHHEARRTELTGSRSDQRVFGPY